ncbi:MAG: hypothetical protein KDB82_07405 [Planctomycetes bacterium]|nr:hypothetical protein [Planctomycetota bacterium]
MTRVLLVVLMLVAVPAVLHAGDEEAVEKFTERTARTNEAVADAHVRLAEWCFKAGLNVSGRDQLQRALKLVPEHKNAMKALGYKQKKVDGEQTWVLDERRAPPTADSDKVSDDDRKRYLSEREKLSKEASKEYVKLAEYAAKLELEARARVTYDVAVKYDPTNEEALKGAGWVKDELGDWISPRDAAEREQTQKALTDTPLAEAIADLPDWTNRVFTGGTGAGSRYGDIDVVGSVNLADAGRYAWAASKLCSELLGGEVGKLRVVVAANSKEHERYCATRQPGVPGLSADAWVLGDKEVEALLDEKDDKPGLERVVYAVAVFEVRRRCGETTHPWFEIAFASNLTRRLLGRVTTAEFSGEPEGPTESGRWKRTLRQLVYDENQPKLREIIVARDPTEHEVIVAHFFVRYLCSERKAALGDFCAALKSSDDDEDAFKSAFEQTAPELNELFVEWFERN